MSALIGVVVLFSAVVRAVTIRIVVAADGLRMAVLCLFLLRRFLRFGACVCAPEGVAAFGKKVRDEALHCLRLQEEEALNPLPAASDILARQRCRRRWWCCPSCRVIKLLYPLMCGIRDDPEVEEIKRGSTRIVRGCRVRAEIGK
jgi:hypothetical protein